MPGVRSGWSDFGRAVSRILSASLRTERIICLSSQYPKPVPRAGPGAGSSSASYLALHPMGFSVPPRSLAGRWALTPPFHPYPALSKADGGLIFCGTIRRKILSFRPRVSPPMAGLRGIAPCGVRTFLPRRLRRKRFSALPKSSKIYHTRPGRTSSDFLCGPAPLAEKIAN